MRARPRPTRIYLTSGDDFSVDTIRTVNEATVAERYTIQIPYFAPMAHSTAVPGERQPRARPIPIIPADHRAACRCGRRTRAIAISPSPRPDGFTPEHGAASGSVSSATTTPGNGRRLVTLDPYWSLPVAVDNVFGDDGGGNPGGGGRRDITRTVTRSISGSSARSREQGEVGVLRLRASRARGGGRHRDRERIRVGRAERERLLGVCRQSPDVAGFIHQLMAANKVTVFFQAHDHLFVR